MHWHAYCIYIVIHTYIHTYMHAYIHTSIHRQTDRQTDRHTYKWYPIHNYTYRYSLIFFYIVWWSSTPTGFHNVGMVIHRMWHSFFNENQSVGSHPQDTCVKITYLRKEMGVSINWDTPIHGWFIMEKILQTWMTEGFPHDFGNLHVWFPAVFFPL